MSPIFTAHLFEPLERALIELLRSLSPEDWERPTIAGNWRVKDVAAHLLDTQLRKLSLVRDGYIAEIPQINSPSDLVSFINRLNHEGVAHYRRLSPAVLIALMETASRASWEFHQSLDPFAPAAFAVSWAGESESANWFDTAREYTERWHHQQQIRLAVNQPGIMTQELYHPVLDAFMRALPFHYRDVSANAGDAISFVVTGEIKGAWHLVKAESGWVLTADAENEPRASITIPAAIAWRIFTKGLDRGATAAQCKVQGDQTLGKHILSMVAIVG